MRRYITLGSSSPGTPSLRGVPVLPRARMTARARYWLLADFTVKTPFSALAMCSTFSRVTQLKSARVRTISQKASRFSLESSVFLNFPYMGNSTGLVMTNFLARVLGNGAADLVLLEGYVVELVFDGAERGADSRGSGAHDEQVIDPRLRWLSRGGPAADESVDAFAPLIDGVLDESEAAEFSDDEQVLEAGLVLRGHVGHVGAHAGRGHDHGDRAYGTRFCAQSVTDALVSVDDGGFASDHGQHIALGTDRGTSGATDAVVDVNAGMLGLGPLREEFALLRGLAELLFLFLEALEIASQKEQGQYRGKDEGYQRVHNSPRKNPSSTPRQCGRAPGLQTCS